MPAGVFSGITDLFIVFIESEGYPEVTGGVLPANTVRSSLTRLDLICDHEDAVLVAEITHAFHEPWRWHDVSPLALNRFDQHRRGFVGR